MTDTSRAFCAKRNDEDSVETDNCFHGISEQPLSCKSMAAKLVPSRIPVWNVPKGRGQESCQPGLPPRLGWFQPSCRFAYCGWASPSENTFGLPVREMSWQKRGWTDRKYYYYRTHGQMNSWRTDVRQTNRQADKQIYRRPERTDTMKSRRTERNRLAYI